MMKCRTYSELLRLSSFEERFDYLKMHASIGIATFGFDRYLNQAFYHSKEWKLVRNEVIIRDKGRDLGIEEREIFNNVTVHHMNLITFDDLDGATPFLLDPEYLICVSSDTHRALHYGGEPPKLQLPIERRPYDTSPWRE